MKQKSKHTPGPWRIRESRSQSGGALRCIERAEPARGGINSLVAVMPDRTPSAAQWEPNARLIATCPEMLDALKLVLRLRDKINEDGYKLLEGIVAKATGGAE